MRPRKSSLKCVRTDAFAGLQDRYNSQDLAHPYCDRLRYFYGASQLTSFVPGLAGEQITPTGVILSCLGNLHTMLRQYPDRKRWKIEEDREPFRWAALDRSCPSRP